MIAALFDTYIENGGKSPGDEPLLSEYQFRSISDSFWIVILTNIHLLTLKNNSSSKMCALASPKGSSSALSSRKGSLHRPNARKGTLPPSYTYSYRHGLFGTKGDNGVDDLDDVHSGASSENGNFPPPINQSDPTITPEELACIRRILRNDRADKPPPKASAPPAPHPNHMTMYCPQQQLPTMTSTVYPIYATDEAGVHQDSHPKALEAQQSMTQC